MLRQNSLAVISLYVVIVLLHLYFHKIIHARLAALWDTLLPGEVKYIMLLKDYF